jgi:serine/threonine-protein kinase
MSVTPEPANRDPAVDGERTSDEGWRGRVIDDRYRVIEKLGEGGMGAVFVAEHLKLRKQVALKIIHPEFAGDGEIAERFAREAMATARVEHPHVASALDYGMLPEGGAYLVMQLVRGPSLRGMLELHQRAGWARAAHVMAQVADALAAAHAAGIVHRDLKPENIHLEPRDDGTELVKVLDFGIARVPDTEKAGAPAEAAPRKALTRVGTIIGTPGYMAPEQALGEVVDARADLYALGVILWEMIAGRHLWADSTDVAALFTRQLTETPPTLREASGDPSVPPELEALVAQLLARSRDARPERAAQVRDVLRTLSFQVSIAAAAAPTGGGSTARLQAIGAAPGLQTGNAITGVGTLPTMVASSTTAAPRSSPDVLARLLETARALPRPLLALGCALPVLAVLGLVVTVASSGGRDAPVAGAPSPPSFLPSFLPSAPPPPPEVPAALERDVDTLLNSDQRQRRVEAARVVLAYRKLDDLPPHLRLLAELETARGCREKKPIIVRLGELGDARALPSVERVAAVRSAGGMFGLGASDPYECMRGELGVTLGVLRDAAGVPSDGSATKRD